MKIELVASLLVIGLGVEVAAQPQQELHKLVASDPSILFFGDHVAIDGKTAVLGAFGDSVNGTSSGSAYVFDVTTGQQLHKLTPSDGAAYDWFGAGVAVSGDLALIGAGLDDDNGVDSGSAYVFNVVTGQELHKLMPADGAADDNFGRHAVALSGNIAVIGARWDGDNGFKSGSAYVFDVTSGQQLHKLTPSDGSTVDIFGVRVAVSGNLALIGAFQADFNGVEKGAAYVFDVTTGKQLHKLAASDGAAADYFGTVGISGKLAVVGSFLDDDLGETSGSAYVFDALTGQQLHKLTASDGVAGDAFGRGVAISGSRVVVSSFGDDDNGTDSGSAYVFDALTGQEVSKLVPSDGAPFDWLRHVAISGDYVLAGTRGQAAYVFDLVSSFSTYGSGCPGAGGESPGLSLAGVAAPGGAVRIDISNGVGGGTAFVFMGLAQSATDIGFGCTLNVDPLLPAVIGPVPLQPLSAQGPGEGEAAIFGSVPFLLDLPTTIVFQAFVLDPASPLGFASTPGVEMQIK